MISNSLEGGKAKEKMAGSLCGRTYAASAATRLALVLITESSSLGKMSDGEKNTSDVLFRAYMFLKMIECHHGLPARAESQGHSWFIFRSGRGLWKHPINPVPKRRGTD